MNDDSDWKQKLLDAWPAAEPSRGFADCVLAACAAPVKLTPHLTIVREPPPRRASRSGIVAAVAIAAAIVLVPLALLGRPSVSSVSPPPPPAAVATVGDSADLGSPLD